MKFPPVCLFPTTTVLLDDDREFLHSLDKCLKNRHTRIKAFDNPSAANSFLRNSRDSVEIDESWLNVVPSDYCYENMAVEIQFSKILELSSNPRRFDQITCIVIDYRLPNIDGLQFLKELPFIRAKKILLTAHADADIAVNAINDGLIDHYVQKHDPHMASKLQGLLAKIQLSYFENLGSLVARSLLLARQEDDELRTAYCGLIGNILSKNKIREYYLADPNGSYTFFGEQGQLDLLIKSREQLHSDIEVAQDAINGFDSIVDNASEVKPLSNKKTFFYSLAARPALTSASSRIEAR
ncbi:MAG: hypothetical protein ACREGC_03265 [Minisyncoccia bacterium]